MSNIFPPRNWVRTLYAYKGTGLPRIAELIRKIQAKRHPNTEVIINDFGVAKFVCRLSEHMGSQIYWRGAYSGAQLKLLCSQLQLSSVFISLDSNIFCTEEYHSPSILYLNQLASFQNIFASPHL